MSKDVFLLMAKHSALTTDQPVDKPLRSLLSQLWEFAERPPEIFTVALRGLLNSCRDTETRDEGISCLVADGFRHDAATEAFDHAVAKLTDLAVELESA